MGATNKKRPDMPNAWKLRRMHGVAPDEKLLDLAYLRVSTNKGGQKELGNGLTTQAQHISAVAALNKWKIDEWLTDADSGSEENREQLMRMRELVAAGRVRRILFFKLDRLSRDAKLTLNILDEFKRAGVDVISATELFDDSPMGDLMKIILAGFAQFEKATITLRLSEGKKTTVSKSGTYGGGPGCLGFRSVGKVFTNADGDRERLEGKGRLEEVPEEIITVKLIFKLRGDGWSYEAIAKQLNALGRTTVKGGPWRGCSVRLVLSREAFYRGQAVMHSLIAPTPLKVAHSSVLDDADPLPTRCSRRANEIDTEGNTIRIYPLRMRGDLDTKVMRGTIARFRELRAIPTSATSTARMLTEEGHRTPSGAIWRTKTIREYEDKFDMLLEVMDKMDKGEPVKIYIIERTPEHEQQASDAEIQRQAAEEARKLYETGDYSYAKIAGELNERFPWRRRWFPSDARHMVLRLTAYREEALAA